MGSTVTEERQQLKRRFIRCVKYAGQLIILALVVWGSWRTIEQALADLAKSKISFAQFDPVWLSVSGLFYLTAMLLFGLFWHRILGLMERHPRLWNSLRAYFISQPGKYVPGKFLVVLLRTTIIRNDRVETTIAVTSTFVETLTMMAIGAVLGSMILAIHSLGDGRLVALAMCLAVAVGLPVFPPVLRRLAKLARLHRLHADIDRSLSGLNVRQLAPGWLGVTLGWFSMGISLWATLQAMPNGDPSLTNLVANTPLLTACIALSTVAGFVSGLPGGLGVREMVVMVLVQPHFGATAAVLSAVVHRCVMIVADLLMAGLMCVIRRKVDS